MCFLFACLGSRTHLCGSSFRTLGTPQWVRERVGGDAADLRDVPSEQAHAWPTLLTSCFRFCSHLQIQRLTDPCCSCPPSQVSADKRTNYSNNTWWSSSPPISKAQSAFYCYISCKTVLCTAHHQMNLTAFAMSHIAQEVLCQSCHICLHVIEWLHLRWDPKVTFIAMHVTATYLIIQWSH